MADIHRRVGIPISTLGDLEKLVQAAKDDGYEADDHIANEKKSIYIYFERGSEKAKPPGYEGKCSQCQRIVACTDGGIALQHYRGDTAHPDLMCYGVDKKVIGIKKVGS